MTCCPVLKNVALALYFLSTSRYRGVHVPDGPSSKVRKTVRGTARVVAECGGAGGKGAACAGEAMNVTPQASDIVLSMMAMRRILAP